MHRFTLLITAALALVLAVAAPEARAQDRLDEPVATETVLSLPGGGTVDGDTLYLPLASQLELGVEALDQYGRPFPQGRLRFELDFDRDCRGLVELVGASDDGVTLRTGKGAGSCAVRLWLPNNLNADRDLRVVANRAAGPAPVAPPSTGGAIDTREELVAASLFRALLAREPDDRWIAAAAEQVRRNQTRDQIRSLVASPEFSERRRTVPPEQLLRDIYQGMLGRVPDPAGTRTYLGDVRQGRFEEVVVDILGSQEFRERVAREIG